MKWWRMKGKSKRGKKRTSEEIQRTDAITLSMSTSRMTGAKRWLASCRGQEAVSTGRTSMSLAILMGEDWVLSATCRARVSTAASAARDVKRTALLVSAISAGRAEEKRIESFDREKGEREKGDEFGAKDE